MTLSAFGFSAAPNRAPLAPETSSRVLFAGWASFIVENAKGEFEICGEYGQEEFDLIAHAKESVDQASSGLVKFYGWESLQGYMSASGDVVGLSRSTSSSTYQPSVLYRNARDVAACGRSKDHLTVVIDKESGKLFQWTAVDPVVKPMLAYTTTSSSLVLENVKFDKIWAGEGHLLALAVDGTLYSWGSGRHGQLGHGDLASEPVPKPIESLQGMRIVDAACGGSFTVALSEAGDVYTFGLNDHGQLGIGNGSSAVSDIQSEPRRNTALPQLVDFYGGDETKPIDVLIVKVACGYAHTVVLDDGGRAWSSGWGKYGQLRDVARSGLENDAQEQQKQQRLCPWSKSQPTGQVAVQVDQYLFLETSAGDGRQWTDIACGLWGTFLWRRPPDTV